MNRVIFEQSAFDDFNGWAATDRKVHARIVELIRDACRSPFTGIGKPEPLKGPLRGYWSRRITDQHRLVYMPTDKGLVIISCRYHY